MRSNRGLFWCIIITSRFISCMLTQQQQCIKASPGCDMQSGVRGRSAEPLSPLECQGKLDFTQLGPTHFLGNRMRGSLCSLLLSFGSSFFLQRDERVNRDREKRFLLYRWDVTLNRQQPRELLPYKRETDRQKGKKLKFRNRASSLFFTCRINWEIVSTDARESVTFQVTCSKRCSEAHKRQIFLWYQERLQI